MAKRRMKVTEESNYITLQDAINDFLEEKELQNCVDKTISNYQYALDKFVKYFEFDDEFKVQDLTQGNINQYKNHLLKEDISFQSVNGYLRHLRTFCYWCEKQGYLEEHFEMKDVKGQETKIKYYTEEEMEALLEKPVGNNNYGAWRMWAVVSFIYATGARAQSVCDVKMEDVDFFKKEITFTHQKNKSLLILPLSEALERTLKEYIRKCNLMNEEYLFPSISGDKLNPHTLNTAIRNYCKSRGVPMHGIHAIRHSFASQYIRNGGNPMKLQKILNHSTLKMTTKYITLFGQDLKVDYSDFSPLDTATRKKSRTKKVGRLD